MAFNQPLYHFKSDFFKSLAHPVRIRILELLRDGEKSVSELQPHLGIELPNISQQLAVLRAGGIIAGRKEGSSVFYSVKNPRVFKLLDVARDLFEESLNQMVKVLEALKVEASPAISRGSSKNK